MSRKLVPVVMCGGAGTRLWPVSRDTMPKQFIPLLGEVSTFQRIMRLLSDGAVFGRPIVVTNAEYRFTVLDQLQAIGVSAQIVLEPTRRDSAAAVATATQLALAADHRDARVLAGAELVPRALDGALGLADRVRAARIDPNARTLAHEIDARLGDPLDLGERLLHAPRARRAAHALHVEGDLATLEQRCGGRVGLVTRGAHDGTLRPARAAAALQVSRISRGDRRSPR